MIHELVKIDILTYYIFNNIFAALIWMDETGKKLSSHIYEPSLERIREVVKLLRWWDDER
jgi:hypothetical protein